MSFPEYVERPKGGANKSELNTSVPPNTGKNFYQRIEDARNSGDTSTLIDFACMPGDWRPRLETSNSKIQAQNESAKKEDSLALA